MISLQNVTLSRGIKLLLQDANAAIHNGQHVGLIGNNGCGKSTLFALLRGEMECEHGEVSLPPDCLISSVRQETPSLDQAAIDYVLDGHQPYREAQKQLAQAEKHDDGIALANAHEAFANADGYSLAAKAAELLVGLGFPSSLQQKSVKEFSGGWRMRLNLAQALIAPSDLLLLDEPTNHLDLDAIIWLQDFLLQHQSTIILISHDKEFLDALCDHILHIENQQLTTYTGNYSTFEKTRYERLAQASANYEKQLQRKAHLDSYIERFRAKSSKARQAQSRIKALEKMALEAPTKETQAYEMRFPDADSYPDNILRLKNADIGYADVALFKQINFTLTGDARIGLLGRNGAGKSTIIKALSGSMPLLSGELILNPRAKIGYFTQHQLDRLRPEESALWHLEKITPEQTQQAQRNFIGGYGFKGEQAEAPVGNFSGGEKARLALALIIAQRPNLLLLDEPTNHLDIAMREALTRALQTYQGAMVIISHDRSMLRATCDSFYLVENAKFSPFEGDLDDYREHLRLSMPEINQAPNKNSDIATSNSVEKLAKKQHDAQIRNQLRPLKKALNEAESLLEKAESLYQKLENQLASADLYLPENKDQLKKLLAEKALADTHRQERETAWIQAVEAVELQEKQLRKFTTT